MMKIKKEYTPNEWKVDGATIYTEQSQEIAQVILPIGHESFSNRRAQRKANARLIATAPDLVDALIEIMTYLQETEWPLTGAAERAYNLGKGALIDAGIIDSEN